MDRPLHDRLTVVAIAIVVFALANIGHEALGHGGACVLVGGQPQVVSAVHFECDEGSLPWRASATVSAMGTLVNLLVAFLAWLLLRRPPRSAAAHLFLWLTFTVNLLQGTGYWLFSGLGNVGDWAAIAQGLPHPGRVRVGLALLGGGGYWLAVVAAVRQLAPIVGGGEDREPIASRLTLTAYLAGGVLYCAAGLLNPVSPLLVLISAAAASFGGTSALAWMSNLLRAPRYASAASSLSVPRSAAWVAAGVLVALVFVAVLGPGVHIS